MRLFGIVVGGKISNMEVGGSNPDLTKNTRRFDFVLNLNMAQILCLQPTLL